MNPLSAMRIPLNNDCWQTVLGFLKHDHNSLFQVLLTCKHLMQLVIPCLYKEPLLDYTNLPKAKKQALEDLLIDQAKAFVATNTDLPVATGDSSSSPSFPLVIATTTLPILPTLPTTTTASPISAISSTSSTTSTPITSALTSITNINYYSFVQEMPDRPCSADEKWSIYLYPCKASILGYHSVVGEKIKRLKMYIADQGVLMESFQKHLSGLQDLSFCKGSNKLPPRPDSDPTSPFGIVRNIITLHREAFPGVLQKVSFSKTLGCDALVSDPGMMMMIRDLMDGNWCTDKLVLELPDYYAGDVDECKDEQIRNLVAILRDDKLPNQVRTVKIYPAKITGDLLIEWMRPLEAFLSKCRILDVVVFSNCPGDVLNWAVNEKLAHDTKSITTTTTFQSLGNPQSLGQMVNPPLVEWKSIHFEFHAPSPTMGFIQTFLAKEQHRHVVAAWSNVVLAFGHCLETLSFCTPREILTRQLSLMPALQLPVGVGDLSCLVNLAIEYYGLCDFSAVDMTNLRRLRFLNREVIAENHGPFERSFPSGVQQLTLFNSTLMVYGVKALLQSLQKLEILSVKCDFGDIGSDTIEDERNINAERIRKAVDFDHGSWVLPSLTTVHLKGFCGDALNLNMLFLGPNITTLALKSRSRKFSIDLAPFFAQATEESTTFPNLEDLTICGSIKLLTEAHFKTLLGLFDSSSTTTSIPSLSEVSKKVMEDEDMFPGLKSLYLDRIGADNEDSTVTFISFSKLVSESLKTGCHRGYRSNQLMDVAWPENASSLKVEWSDSKQLLAPTND